jgi:hypothetical protein
MLPPMAAPVHPAWKEPKPESTEAAPPPPPPTEGDKTE